MKKVSLKVKLTLLYTACMVFVIGFIFAVLFSISNREVLASTQMKLKNRVQESMDEVEWEDGQLEVDSDFYQIEDNVYLALYDEMRIFYMESGRQDLRSRLISQMERCKKSKMGSASGMSMISSFK